MTKRRVIAGYRGLAILASAQRSGRMQFLFYQGDMTAGGARNVEALLTSLMEEGAAEATLCLASYGGDVNAGIGLYNFIGMIPMRVHTHAAGICSSIAVTVMVAGERRTASPLSVFSTHAATYNEGPLKGQPAPNTGLISQPFRSKLSWSEDEIQERFSTNDYRFSPEVAQSLGLITEVIDLKLSATDRMITVRID